MNRTTRYLSLGLHVWSGFSELYQDIVISEFDPVFYMEDVNYKLEREDYIILVLDTDYKKERKTDFEEVKQRLSEMLIDDYVVGNINDSTKHALVLRLPSQEIRKQFLKGGYSKMFETKFLDSLKANKIVEMTDALGVILKSKNALIRFKKHLNEQFKTTLTEKDLSDRELDFPVTYQREKEILI